tara:strand:- start:10 stop:483 length:474 start_codon:yes stop_codon:yes gene_type:complete
MKKPEKVEGILNLDEFKEWAKSAPEHISVSASIDHFIVLAEVINNLCGEWNNLVEAGGTGLPGQVLEDGNFVKYRPAMGPENIPRPTYDQFLQAMELVSEKGTCPENVLMYLGVSPGCAWDVKTIQEKIYREMEKEGADDRDTDADDGPTGLPTPGS